MTVVLGVDCGSLSTGYGVVEGDGSRHRALAYGTIRNRSDTVEIDRIQRVAKGLREVIREFQPTILSVEDVFVSKNPRSALKLGQIRGAVLLVAYEEGLSIREFSPTAVKTSVAGYGRAEKTQVQAMVKALLGLPSLPQPHDASDALAIAICALAGEGWRRAVGEKP